MSSYFDYFDAITSGQLKLVDLRSPGEFALGAMPHAINAPLFTNDERAHVGTTYKQVGQLEAVQQGLELVAEKIPGFLDQLIDLAGPERRLALHCWRGGMRSGSVAKLLEVVGITPILIRGGYKAYRNQVLKNITELSQHKLVVLNGRTGSGKTELIHRLVAMNAPVIDLEGLAKHRGSALGHLSINSNQPTQQQFENDLANAYVKVKHHPTIIVEIEQNIGSIQMPQHLRKHIYNSDIVLIERDFEDRVQHIAAEYAPAWSDADDAKFQAGILLLKKHIKSEIYQQILTHVQRREFHDAIRLLMIHRYDQCYDKTIKRQTASIIATINMSTEGSLAQKRLLSLTSSESNPGID